MTIGPFVNRYSPSRFFIDIFPINAYLKIEIIQGGYTHGTEKSRETETNKDQSQTAGILQKARIIEKIRT
jgi:hypothetical protein